MTFYCPTCWHEMSEAATQCPICSYDLKAYESLPYAEKMLLALSHPIRENRLMAIEALGRLQYVDAVPHLARLLKQEEDYYSSREALLALSRINTKEGWQLIKEASDHASQLVRHYAGQMIRNSTDA